MLCVAKGKVRKGQTEKGTEGERDKRGKGQRQKGRKGPKSCQYSFSMACHNAEWGLRGGFMVRGCYAMMSD